METQIIQLSSEELRSKVEQDKIERATAFKAWIQEGSDKFNCKIDPVITITGNDIKSSLTIIPL